MTPHEDPEALSAYIDGELDAGERRRVESHLLGCATCATQKAELERVTRAVASLPEVSPTAEESRVLRRRLSELAPRSLPVEDAEVPSSAGRPWQPGARQGVFEVARRRIPLGARTWGAAGALALAAAGVVGFAVLRNPPAQERAASPPSLEAAAAPLAFASEEQVREVVASRPEVVAGVKRYRVSDVGARQAEALRTVGAQAPAPAADAAGEAKSETTSAAAPAPAQRGAAPERSAGECLESVLESQPHPLMPLVSAPATFMDEPVWLLVYAWTSEPADQAPLDRVQVWLVTRTDCTPRHYSQFRV